MPAGTETRPTRLHKPWIGDEETEMVSRAVANGQVTHGPHVEIFESRVADRCGARYGVAVSSGTAALHLALLSHGIGPGDEVIVPAFTFVATANAVSYCGAVPVFVDVDKYGSLCPVKLDLWLASRPAKAVVCVHSFGHLCDVEELRSVCDFHEVPLIEDAAQAFGVLSETETAALSFNGNKTITTGGGGAVVTNDRDKAEAIRNLANVSKVDIKHRFWHARVGFNYRMPNMNAALGCAQLNRLDHILEMKRDLVRAYDAVLPGFSLPVVRPTNHWLNALLISDRKTRGEIADALAEEKIETRMSWTPLHLLSMYSENPRDGLENTISLAESIINIPSGAL